ncbi:MAG: hypothetical protein AB7Q17_13920 [Phycisphaerae bacterium]
MEQLSDRAAGHGRGKDVAGLAALLEVLREDLPAGINAFQPMSGFATLRRPAARSATSNGFTHRREDRRPRCFASYREGWWVRFVKECI